MIRALLIVTPIALAGCSSDGASQVERQRALKEARAGMGKVRALPGGRQATFKEVRLVGSDTVCGMIDGNDGVAPHAFSVSGGVVTIADERDPATGATVTAACTGQPSREITSRNAQFSDIDLAE